MSRESDNVIDLVPTLQALRFEEVLDDPLAVVVLTIGKEGVYNVDIGGDATGKVDLALVLARMIEVAHAVALENGVLLTDAHLYRHHPGSRG